MQLVQSLGLGVGLLVLRRALGGVLALTGDHGTAWPGAMAGSVVALVGLGFVTAVLGAVLSAHQPVLHLKEATWLHRWA